MSKAPYPKRTPSQSHTPAFYWRGGDILREREYLADEYKLALADYRRAEFELKQVQEGIEEASETLHEREGYTTALANLLDADVEGNQTEQDSKRRLIELEAEIKDAEAELQEARAVHHPAITSGLQKEKAYLKIEMQRTEKAIELTREQEEDEKKKLAKIVITQRYQTAVDLETKLGSLQRKANFLRGLVNRTKNEFDNVRPVTTVQTDEARLERNALTGMIDPQYTVLRGDERNKRRPTKWKNVMERLFWRIDELNARMYDLAIDESHIVDVEALREKYLPSEQTEEANENAEEQNEEAQNEAE